jgi:hypothetical protein
MELALFIEKCGMMTQAPPPPHHAKSALHTTCNPLPNKPQSAEKKVGVKLKDECRNANANIPASALLRP